MKKFRAYLITMLLIMSFVSGYLFNNVTTNTVDNAIKSKETVKKMAKKSEDKPIIKTVTTNRKKVVVKTRDAINNNDIDEVVSKNFLSIVQDKVAIKSRYVTSYYINMISNIHIRDPMTKAAAKSLGLGLITKIKKSNFIALSYNNIFDFIADVAHNSILREQVKILVAGNNSP